MEWLKVSPKREMVMTDEKREELAERMGMVRQAYSDSKTQT